MGLPSALPASNPGVAVEFTGHDYRRDLYRSPTESTRGQIWIDDNDEQIAHFEIEFTEDVSAGFGVVGKVYKGSRYRMELAKQVDNLWLPVLAETILRMRTLVMKTNEK